MNARSLLAIAAITLQTGSAQAVEVVVFDNFDPNGEFDGEANSATAAADDMSGVRVLPEPSIALQVAGVVAVASLHRR